MKKKHTFESAVTRLEEIVSQLEDEAVSLEKSLLLYKEGVGLAKICNETLTHVEAEVTVLQKESESIFTEKPFGNGNGEV